MAIASPHKPVTLVYGNQRHPVERTAETVTDRVLGDAPRDFAYHRFDAEEILGRGSPDAAGEGVDAFELACRSVPFLSEIYLVRVDHLECVRMPARAAAAITRALGELRVVRVRWEGQAAWVAEGEAPSDLPAEGRTTASEWVREVLPAAEGGALLTLGEAPPLYLLRGAEGLRAADLRAFLRAELKGKFQFADEADAAAPTGHAASAAARWHQLLEHLIEQPPPGCHLLLTASAARDSDLSAPLLKAIRRHGVVEKFITYDDYNPVDWVMREGRGRGLRFGRETAGRIIETVGSDLAKLAHELDKLSLLKGEGELDEGTLLAHLHGTGRHSAFWITEVLGRRDLAGAINALEQFERESGGDYPVMVGILARFFRQLALVHALKAQGMASEALAGKLKLHPFIAKKVEGQAERFTPGEVEAILVRLAELDRELRRPGRLAPLRFQAFAMAVCSPRQVRSTGGEGPNGPPIAPNRGQ